MNDLIPEKWQGCEDAMPILRDAVEWISLRQWSLSSVYRIILNSGHTMIGKWSDCSLINENQFYNDVLAPLDIERAEIYASHRNIHGSYFIIQDLGEETLESKPSPDSFIKAVHELARIHKTSIMGIKNNLLSKTTFEKHYQNKQTFIDELSKLQQNPFFDRAQQSSLNMLVKILPDHVCQVYKKCPVTLVHNDYYPKNLIVVKDRIKVIDWTDANFSPLLSDLFGIIHAAEDYGVSEEDILKAYLLEAHDVFHNLDTLKWLVDIGAICWLVHTVRWILDSGRYVIPGSEDWIEDLMKDLEILHEKVRGKVNYL